MDSFVESKLESNDGGKLSLCNVLKDDTTEIIQKLELQAPTLFQINSDLYTTYLHMFDDMFGTCYLSEKEFFDKLNIDQGILKQVKLNSEAIKKICLENIDMYTKYLDASGKMKISAIKSFDNYFHVMMQSYGQFLSQFNEYAKNRKNT